MDQNFEVTLRRRPAAAPIADDFELVERAKPLSAPRDGLLLRVIALSLDPYMGPQLRHGHMGDAPPSPGDSLPGFGVGQVMASNHPDFQVGDIVVAETGWRKYAAISAKGARKVDPSIPPSAHLGVLGMPGLTGWAGATQLAKVGPKDIFVVDAAAGPVGGTAGQIARNMGAHVIGIAGGAEKCVLVRERYGFDDCIDYKQPDWQATLKKACGAGPTIHFENVGLSVLNAVMPLLQNYARVVLCGLAEHYHMAERAQIPIGDIVAKRAALLGLVVYDFYARQNEWTELGARWLKDGKLKIVEDIAPDLADAPALFEKLMRGKNVGKAVVRVSPDEA